MKHSKLGRLFVIWLVGSIASGCAAGTSGSYIAPVPYSVNLAGVNSGAPRLAAPSYTNCVTSGNGFSCWQDFAAPTQENFAAPRADIHYFNAVQLSPNSWQGWSDEY